MKNEMRKTTQPDGERNGLQQRPTAAEKMIRVRGLDGKSAVLGDSSAPFTEKANAAWLLGRKFFEEKLKEDASAEKASSDAFKAARKRKQ